MTTHTSSLTTCSTLAELAQMLRQHEPLLVELKSDKDLLKLIAPVAAVAQVILQWHPTALKKSSPTITVAAAHHGVEGLADGAAWALLPLMVGKPQWRPNIHLVGTEVIRGEAPQSPLARKLQTKLVALREKAAVSMFGTQLQRYLADGHMDVEFTVLMHPDMNQFLQQSDKGGVDTLLASPRPVYVIAYGTIEVGFHRLMLSPIKVDCGQPTLNPWKLNGPVDAESVKSGMEVIHRTKGYWDYAGTIYQLKRHPDQHVYYRLAHALDNCLLSAIGTFDTKGRPFDWIYGFGPHKDKEGQLRIAVSNNLVIYLDKPDTVVWHTDPAREPLLGIPQDVLRYAPSTQSPFNHVLWIAYSELVYDAIDVRHVFFFAQNKFASKLTDLYDFWPEGRDVA